MAEEQGTTFGLRGHRMLDPDTKHAYVDNKG